MTTRNLALALGLTALLAGCGKYGPPVRSELPPEPLPPGVAPAPSPAPAPAPEPAGDEPAGAQP